MLSLRYLMPTVLSVGLLVLPTFVLSAKQTGLSKSFVAQAQSTSPEAAIDRLFRSGSPPPGAGAETQRLFANVKSWMGSYQGVQKEGSSYLARFERGSLPVSVRLDGKGQIRGIGFGCPRSTSLNLSQASKELRQLLSRCPGLQN